MADKKVAQESISKALESLTALAKGHSSRGTASTAVDSMRDAGAGAGSDAGSTQVHHTPSNSDPGGWAGSKASSVSEDGASDGIDANGTDYKGASKLMKSIFAKLAKGQPLSDAEQYILKSLVKAKGEDEDEDEVAKGKDADEDDEKDAKDKDDKAPPFGAGKAPPFGKSMQEAAEEHDEVRKGLELSPFLAGWAEVQSDSLSAAEERIVSRVVKSLSRIDADNAAFQTNMAKSIAALAEVLTLQGQRLEQVESTPARGPKSITTAEAVEKSFGGAPEQLEKSVILDSLVDMVQKGQIPASEVVRFDSTGNLRQDLLNKVIAHRSGR